MKWLRLSLQVGLVAISAAAGALFAFANQLGAKTIVTCQDTIGAGGITGSCIDPPAAPWAVGLAAGCGAVLAVALIQIVKHLPKHTSTTRRVPQQ